MYPYQGGVWGFCGLSECVFGLCGGVGDVGVVELGAVVADKR
jgi:hypothetical protein